ncbi:MAG: cell division protein, partial [Alphaproteobacteria bacterium RIFOXYD12_FULL_60_8]
MFGRSADLPLAKDATSRFLPWLIAVMVFLAAVAIAGALATEVVVAGWHRDISGTITVQIMPASGLAEVSRDGTDKRVETALRILETTPGVTSARALDRDKTAALLEPWLGSREVFEDLPIPRLIDVSLAPDRNINLDALSRRLSESVPGASLDDHQLWLGKLVRFAYGLEMLAGTVIGLTTLALTSTVIYATRTGLAVHFSV